MARKVGAEGRVLAFEPQGFIYSLLKSNLVVNNVENVEAHYAALGATPGEVLIPMFDYAKGENFSGYGREHWQKIPKERCFTVELLTVDQLGLTRLDLLQLDVEYMEREVLLGAQQTIAKHRPKIFLENNGGEEFGRLINYLREINYTPYWMVTFLFNKNNYFENEVDVFKGACSFNMYCVPNEREEWKVEGLREAQPTDPQGDAGGVPAQWVVTGVEGTQ